jgi:hypothetical protein
MRVEAKDMLNRLPRWEHFDHQSDIGVGGLGRSREETLAQAAQALIAVVTEPARVVALSAPDDEMLLVDWLNAIIYEMATRGMIFGRFSVQGCGRGRGCRGTGGTGAQGGSLAATGLHQRLATSLMDADQSVSDF